MQQSLGETVLALWLLIFGAKGRFLGHRGLG